MKHKTIAEKITHYEPSNFFPACDPIRNVPNRLCASCSQSLFTLTVIEDFLAKRPVPPSPNTSSRDRPNQNWVRNHNYYSKSSEIMIKNAFLLFICVTVYKPCLTNGTFYTLYVYFWLSGTALSLIYNECCPLLVILDNSQTLVRSSQRISQKFTDFVCMLQGYLKKYFVNAILGEFIFN